MSGGASNYEPGQWGLRDKFAPILGLWTLMVRLHEVPPEVRSRLSPLFAEITNAIQDDELGLIGATPEQRSTRLAEQKPHLWKKKS